ncbi:MAG: isopenicillin N synthase family dioxygenase, partial [Gammaproteobacteria bacterium]
MTDHNAAGAPGEDLSAKRLAFREIPVIDIAGLFSRDNDAVHEVAAKIGDACRNVGFFYVSHHGVSAQVVDSLLEHTQRFFALPIADKMKYDITAVQRHRGFVPFGGLTAAVDGKPDFQEAFEVSVELPESDPDYLAGNMMYGPNVWPEHLPGFREGVYGYFEAAMNLGSILARAFAITLRQPENYFETCMNKPITQLRLLYYPPQEDRSDELGIGVGTHCDYEMFT